MRATNVPSTEAARAIHSVAQRSSGQDLLFSWRGYTIFASSEHISVLLREVGNDFGSQPRSLSFVPAHLFLLEMPLLMQNPSFLSKPYRVLAHASENYKCP